MTRSTRKLPVPFNRSKRTVGRGHLLPDLVEEPVPTAFVALSTGRRCRYGMLAYIGTDVSGGDLIRKWEERVGPVPNRALAEARIERFLNDLVSFRIGNVVTLSSKGNGEGMLRLVMQAPQLTAALPIPE